MISKLYKDKDWIFNQYITLEKSINEIARTYEVSYNTIHIWLKKFNIPIRTLSEALKISHNKPEYKKKMSEFNLGEKNPNWKKKRDKYNDTHAWIDKHFIKPEFCEICEKPSFGRMMWSNKSGKLIRDRINWQYVHQGCHRRYDVKNKIIHEGIKEKESEYIIL